MTPGPGLFFVLIWGIGSSALGVVVLGAYLLVRLLK